METYQFFTRNLLGASNRVKEQFFEHFFSPLESPPLRSLCFSQKNTPKNTKLKKKTKNNQHMFYIEPNSIIPVAKYTEFYAESESDLKS